MAIHSGQSCEAWVVKSCSLFDSTLLVSARVHIRQSSAHSSSDRVGFSSFCLHRFVFVASRPLAATWSCACSRRSIIARWHGWPHEAKRLLRLCKRKSVIYVFICGLFTYICVAYSVSNFKWQSLKIGNQHFYTIQTPRSICYMQNSLWQIRRTLGMFLRGKDNKWLNPSFKYIDM